MQLSDDALHRSFQERIAATTIVNQAAIRCIYLGLPLTDDNVVRWVGDFVDPSQPQAAGLINAILKAIDDLFTIGPTERRERFR